MKKTYNLPLISFITPNFNDGKTIARQVDSIMDQDYPSIEQIIVDDGSTDDSKKVLEALKKKYPKLRVIYLGKNKGACEARNIGAEEATGKYLSFLPADAKLYPGVARIWVEELEKHPEYDFLYGGYKFTDENYHEAFSYMADDFDPYFLKITNYIDGSFPLKKSLFDKMGGWDTQIKSLQDWDLWLNAVINHNAKGLFRKEVFFETTLPHAGGLSDDSHRNWLARTTQIKKKYNIPISKICVTGPGAAFHAKNVAKILGADYLPVPSFKPHNYEMIYVIGFFGEVARAFWNTNAMRVVHWIGSDILQLQQASPEQREKVVQWIDNNVDINLCEMEATQKELAEIGIKARMVPFPPQKIYKTIPLPEKKAVAVYLPYMNKQFYYPDFIYNIAKKMPDVDFHSFGDPMMRGLKENVTYHGIIGEKEKDELIKKTSLILRLTPHDGLPLSVIEWITAGRNAITTVMMPHAMNFKIKAYDGKKKPTKARVDKVVKENEVRLINLINSALKNELNANGSEYYHKLCEPSVFSKTIHNFMNVDIKKWWDEMSDLWPSVEQGQESTEDIIKVIKEVKELNPKNVVDLGCGTGRWKGLLPVTDYTGVDISADLIKVAKTNYPKGKFIVTNMKDVNTKFDMAFTFATWLHIKPEEIKKYVKAIKKIAKRAIFIEPVRDASSLVQERTLHPEIIKKQKDSDFIFNIKHTWNHDYLRHFKVTKVIKLSNNREMYIIDLTK